MVAHVIRYGRPHCDIWYYENFDTRRKIAARISRPIDMAALAANHTDPIEVANWTSATASMMPPNRQITSVLPVAIPSSIISALRAGRNKIAETVASWSTTTATSWPADGRAKRARSLSKDVPTRSGCFYRGPFVHIFISHRHQLDRVVLQLFFGFGLRVPTRDRSGLAFLGHDHNRNRLGDRAQVTIFWFAAPGAHHQIHRPFRGVHDTSFDLDDIPDVDAVIKLHATGKHGNRGLACPARRAHKGRLVEPVHDRTTLQTETRGHFRRMRNETQQHDFGRRLGRIRKRHLPKRIFP